MPIPASIIAQLRALNSGHIIAAVNQEQNIMVDGTILTPTTYLSAPLGTGAYTKDQIEGFNMLTPAAQTAMVTALNTAISSLLSSASQTQLVMIATFGPPTSQFSDSALLIEQNTVQTAQLDNTYTFRTPNAIDTQVAAQTYINRNNNGGNTTITGIQNLDVLSEVISEAAVGGTIPVAAAILALQQPN